MASTNTPKDVDEEYVAVSRAGDGVCGKVTFCIRRPHASNDASQRTTIVAVKMAENEMRHANIAQEIQALQHIKDIMADARYADMQKHILTLLDFDPPVPNQGSLWLTTNAVCGFNLEQLAHTITNTARSSSNDVENDAVISPTLHATLILHIAQQLVQTVEWLHMVADIAHQDIFTGNVMLDMSAGSASPLPTVVVIDFDCAVSHPSLEQRGADRSFIYELLHSLMLVGGSTSTDIGGINIMLSRLQDAASDAGFGRLWSHFVEVLAQNQNRVPRSNTMGLAEFQTRFAARIVALVQSVSHEDRQRVRRLGQRVMTRFVKFPGEEKIEAVLEGLEGGIA
ncbi:hypothetical protein ACJQWK_07951 [Exserohilum turcicum]|uniref:Protein kinase domain-containing protein n=1 Tax=Exserohilum turcicum (strain 28A) TaxID=671987 RepID=R0K4K4_EXST2|nr:uncharacterized protein SETTUDRAFT_29258 [Exserohilum turcica Et28A]EOA84474.1 hypothetical protein SETTUDRAFT_29258 [Exserohilum turcica Et28A]